MVLVVAAFLISLLSPQLAVHTATAQTCSFDFASSSCTCSPLAPFTVSSSAECVYPANSGVTPSTGGSGGTVKLDNPLNTNDPRVIIGNVIKVALGLVGSLALLLFIYGGLMWMTSAGNADRLKRGLDTLVWAAIGLIVILGSYTIVNFVIQNLPKAGS